MAAITISTTGRKSSLLKNHFLSSNVIIFFGVTLAHVTILIIFFTNRISNEQPVLSFTVTMMDASSSPNAISSASKMSNMTKKKTSKEIELKKNNSQSPLSEEKKQADENNEKQSTHIGESNSKQQDTVLASDKAAIINAAYLNNPSPSYPPLSRHLKEQGKVLLNVYINSDGKVEQINLYKSSGYSRLDNAALTTVKNWRFTAAKPGQQLKPLWVQVPISFILD